MFRLFIILFSALSSNLHNSGIMVQEHNSRYEGELSELRNNVCTVHDEESTCITCWNASVEPFLDGWCDFVSSSIHHRTVLRMYDEF
jgi:hypothetical protein